MVDRVGIVIPAWYPAATPAPEIEKLLLTTLADAASCAAPADVVVVPDGCPAALEAAERLRESMGPAWGAPFELVPLPENQGKGAALAAGIRHLLRRERPPEWIAARDADGDHMLDDLPHLYRIGEQIAGECPGVPVAVIGSRASVHAPLGWVRGEYELLLNDAIVDAVAFALARDGSAWDARYLIQRAPDLQSGYKLYSRTAAELAVRALAEQAPLHPELKLLRTGMELVPFVTLALQGAVFGEAGRKSYQDQPVSAYGSLDFPTFYGRKLEWVFRRCEVAPAAAAVMLDSAAARRPLLTHPDGRESFLTMRTRVLEALSGGEPVPPFRMRHLL
ncbi:MAG: hypothetical protein ACK47B_19720 [Armatimonadota bacterium]